MNDVGGGKYLQNWKVVKIVLSLKVKFETFCVCLITNASPLIPFLCDDVELLIIAIGYLGQRCWADQSINKYSVDAQIAYSKCDAI